MIGNGGVGASGWGPPGGGGMGGPGIGGPPYGGPPAGYQAPPPPKKSRSGLWIGLGVVLLLICVCCGGAVAVCAPNAAEFNEGFNRGMNEAKVEQVQRTTAAIRVAVASDPNAPNYEPRLQQFETMAPNVGFLTFGLIQNRYQDAMRDGRMTPEEAAFMMELVDDILANDGNVDINRYPGGR